MPRAPFERIAASQVTDERVWRSRRTLLQAGLLLPAIALAGCRDRPYGAVAPLPAGRDSPGALRTSEPPTRFADASTYNNYYEFGTAKDEPARNAQALRTRPWSVEVAGHAERTGVFALEDILRIAPAEERIYRMRCVEAWSMVIPWLGLPPPSPLLDSDTSVDTGVGSPSSAALRVCQARAAHLTLTGNSDTPANTASFPSSGASRREAWEGSPVMRSWKRSKSASTWGRLFPLTLSVIMEAEAVEIEQPEPLKATSLTRSPSSRT